MTLHYIDVPPSDPYTDHTMTNVIPQSSSSSSSPSNDFYTERGTASAPAHLVFHHPHGNSYQTNELDFDVSPLTSPWLGSNTPGVPPPPPPLPPAHPSSSQKRTATNSGDDEAAVMGAAGAGKSRRQKISPPMPPINSSQNPTGKKTHRSSKSMTATPLLRSSRSRGGSIAATGETPSPVDLSMPPPELPPVSFVLSSSTSIERSVSSSPQTNPTLMPVTPASIMNLGRLGLDTSLAPQPLRSDTTPHARRRSISKPSKHMSTNSSMISPGLKPILPGKETFLFFFFLPTHVEEFTYTAGTSSVPLSSMNTGVGGSSPSHPHPPAPPVMQVRKTSHKAAEQKRRDSLKTTFDDLRVLLPPIPLPSDENYPDEPILPGALPPRGPPKTGGEGPNKAVSKLQLLRCGNDFIRQLQARVQRRDEEIDKLRREVKRLREIVGLSSADATADEQLDLERDLDAVEPPGFTLGHGNMGGDYEADEEGEEE
jgi:hypothetical protein